MKFKSKVAEPNRVSEHVWAGTKIIADFNGGFFETQNKGVAEELRRRGYEEILAEKNSAEESPITAAPISATDSTAEIPQNSVTEISKKKERKKR